MIYKLKATNTLGLVSETTADLDLEEKELEDKVVILCPPEDHPMTDEEVNNFIERLSDAVSGSDKTYFVSGTAVNAFEIERIDSPPKDKRVKRSRIEALELRDEE